jgi:hypothetical protein
MTLPNFLIIGAAKAGTTSLWRYLNHHPQIFMSPIKETMFFAYQDPYVMAHWSKLDLPFQITSIESYINLFSDVTDEIAVGEASPIYLESPKAPERIKRDLPGVRLITSLRHPVDRAYSGYLMHLRNGTAGPDIEKAFEPEALYVQGSYYFEKLYRYYKLFSREQIRICLFDELKQQPDRLVKDLFRFLGVDDTVNPVADQRHNAGFIPKFNWLNSLSNHNLTKQGYKALPEFLKSAAKKMYHFNKTEPPGLPYHIRKQLQEMYQDDIIKVQDLIQKDLSGWLTNE